MKMHVNITGKACAFVAALLTRSALLELAIRKAVYFTPFPCPYSVDPVNHGCCGKSHCEPAHCVSALGKATP